MFFFSVAEKTPLALEQFSAIDASLKMGSTLEFIVSQQT
jgi:hypothetical protein